jgi:TetR/AcrR family transcriptional regulator, repressor for neighboring sulfatase
MTPKPTSARRRRFPADEARARILATAETRLAEVGPERLRLTELAAELGISHQAILHHFGSREELVSAVLAQAIARINQRLAEAMSGRGALTVANRLDMVAEYYGAEGRARLLAWLVLSEKSPQVHAKAQAARPLQPLLELVHAQRKKAAAGRRVELADSRFLCQLAALAVLGDALFGDLVRLAFGDAGDAGASRDFRHRFARLLTESR